MAVRLPSSAAPRAGRATPRRRRRERPAASAVLVDPRPRALPLDLRDAVERAEDEVAVDDRELGAIERADGRPGGAVALGVVLAAVARAAEAGRQGRGSASTLSSYVVFWSSRPARSAAPGSRGGRSANRAREARHAVEQAVVADVHRPPAHLADLRVLEEGRDHELALGEVVDRAEVDAPARPGS